jgi:hypothetical protein
MINIIMVSESRILSNQLQFFCEAWNTNCALKVVGENFYDLFPIVVKDYRNAKYLIIYEGNLEFNDFATNKLLLDPLVQVTNSTVVLVSNTPQPNFKIQLSFGNKFGGVLHPTAFGWIPKLGDSRNSRIFFEELQSAVLALESGNEIIIF